MKNLFNKVYEFFFETIGGTAGTTMALIAAVAPLVIIAILASALSAPSHPSSVTVKITNFAGTRGGSGVVIKADENESRVLTNNHVCEGVVARGGKVTKVTGEEHLVTGYVAADDHDLCVLTVAANLGETAPIATKAPMPYEPATVTGHPALLPNVINTGHFGGRQIINVMTGIKPCTKEQMESRLGLMCKLLGGFPIIRTYESMLVTASIMGGSSGSAVLNSRGQVSGLVFAGQGGGLSYAFVVPHEAILSFLGSEVEFKLKYYKKKPTLELDLDASEESKKLRKAFAECNNPDSQIFDTKECEFIRKDYGSDTWKL